MKGNPESGLTIIEGVITSSMVAFVGLLLASVAGAFARDSKELARMTDNLTEVQAARHRLLRDVTDAANVLCPASDRLRVVTDGSPPPVRTYDYKRSSGNLIREWSAAGKTVTVATGLNTIVCTDTGGGSVTVVFDFGAAPTEERLALRITQGTVGL